MSNPPQTTNPNHWHHVAYDAQIVEGACLLVEVEGRSIGMFRYKGEIRAILNICPHAGEPLCMGAIRGTTLPSASGRFMWGRENEVLRCPWHGWEFSLDDGQCLFNSSRLGLVPTEVRDNEEVYVYMRPRRHRPLDSI